MTTPNTAKAILLGLCPRCGQGPLFHGYIAVHKSCPACGLDYSIFDPGDGPAVFGILIVGAIVCGLDEVDVLITDRGIDAAMKRAIEAAGARLIVAD